MRTHLIWMALAAMTAAACSHQTKPSPQAHAKLQAVGNSLVRGQATFSERTDGQLMISARVEGLQPNATHGFHIHENGSCQDNGNAAGGHFNPLGSSHGKYNTAQHHAGDLPSLQADANGIAVVNVQTPNLRLSSGPNGVVNRALIVHANADDYTSQPAGNAGARIACAVITQ